MLDELIDYDPKSKEDFLLDVAVESKERGIPQVARIKAIFALADKTASSLAEAASLNVADLSKVIAGKRTTPYVQEAIVNFLGVPGTVLFDKFKGKQTIHDQILD